MNLGAGQRLRYRTVLFGVQRVFLKRRIIDARNRGLGLQVDPGNGERLADLFEGVDVIAWPTIPAPAPPLDAPLVELPSGTNTADQANVRGAALANLTGIPSISMPVGLSGEGLPLALQLQAAWGRDELLLDAAEALERANGRRWVESLPPMAAASPTEA